MSLWTRNRSALAVAVVACAWTAELLAQSRTVVFQHGLRSNGSTWSPLIANLRDLAIVPRTPSLTQSNWYTDQAVELAAAVNGIAANSIVVGHSNGGIVARVANMPSPQPNRQWGGLITIGTPHLGAPLALSFLNGWVDSWLLSVSRALADAFLYYYNLPGLSYLTGLAYAIHDVNQLLYDILFGVVDMLFQRNDPVLLLMNPLNAGWQQTLNGAANLARENENIPVRVGIVSVVNNTGLVWKGLAGPDWQAMRNVQLAWEDVIVGTAIWYGMGSADDQNDPYTSQLKRDNVWQLWDAFFALHRLDDGWCLMIGAGDGYSCGQSDGVVPAVSATYPGATYIRTLSEVNHRQETSSPATEIELRTLFQNVFNIPSNGTGGGGFNVSISGFVGPEANSIATYSATSSGGTAPFSYYWTVDGNYVGSNSTFDFSTGPAGYGYRIAVTATDANGATAESFLDVWVNTGGCLSCSINRGADVKKKPSPRSRPTTSH